MSFDTGYVGAHRWHVEHDIISPPTRSYKWACVCGRTGSIATDNIHFVEESFARHAHDALEEAAVSLLAAYMPYDSYRAIQDEVSHLRRAEDNDQANLLQLVANHRYQS